MGFLRPVGLRGRACLSAGLLLGAATAAAQESAQPALAEASPRPAELRAATVVLNVRAEASHKSSRIGRLEPGYPLWVDPQPREGPGCDAGWIALEAGGFVCASYLEPGEGDPVVLPVLVPFDPPEPDEYQRYRDEGSYDVAPVDVAPRLLPFIYGKRWRNWKGEVYGSAEHYAHGDLPSDQLDRSSKHAFLEAVDTPRGQVLVQDDGSVVPVDQVFLYPVDRFAGRDLVADPVPHGQLPSWVFGYDGAQVRTEPSPKAEVGLQLPFHAALAVDATPASEDGRWWRVPDALGEGVDGYVDRKTQVRVWTPAPAPQAVAVDELWLDVDTDQQLLALRRGGALLYMTLVSTGTGGRFETPTGLFTVYDKQAWGDMASLPGADEEYHVEKVPWVAHFWPRFALHGVFWHWGFGNRASHGCINLAPRDAAFLFEHMGPRLPAGWQGVWAYEGNQGTVLRVRYGDDVEVRDRRR